MLAKSVNGAGAVMGLPDSRQTDRRWPRRADVSVRGHQRLADFSAAFAGVVISLAALAWGWRRLCLNRQEIELEYQAVLCPQGCREPRGRQADHHQKSVVHRLCLPLILAGVHEFIVNLRNTRAHAVGRE